MFIKFYLFDVQANLHRSTNHTFVSVNKLDSFFRLDGFFTQRTVVLEQLVIRRNRRIHTRLVPMVTRYVHSQNRERKGRIVKRVGSPRKVVFYTMVVVFVLLPHLCCS